MVKWQFSCWDFKIFFLNSLSINHDFLPLFFQCVTPEKSCFLLPWRTFVWTMRSSSSTLLLLAQSTGQQQSENAVVFHREKFFPIISSDGEAEGDTRTVMSGWQWGKNTSPHLKAPLGLTEEPKEREKRELCSMEKACLSCPQIPFTH